MFGREILYIFASYQVDDGMDINMKAHKIPVIFSSDNFHYLVKMLLMNIVSVSLGAASHCDMPVIPWKLDLIGIGFFGRTPPCAISTLGDKCEYVNVFGHTRVHVHV